VNVSASRLQCTAIERLVENNRGHWKARGLPAGAPDGTHLEPECGLPDPRILSVAVTVAVAVRRVTQAGWPGPDSWQYSDGRPAHGHSARALTWQ
jgi:hypothetical protein